MFCKNCGTELKENAVFCHQCGESISPEIVEETKNESPKVWNIFSKIGFVGGLICFITSFIPYIGFASAFMAINFIVLSALGKKTTNLFFYNKAKKGLKFSIAASIIGLIGYVLFLFLIIILANA